LATKVPFGADEVAETVKVDEALPPAGGVTVAGAKLAVTPAGTPEMLRPVATLNPFVLPTVTVVEVPPLPLAVDTLIAAGETARVKSGAGTTVTASEAEWLTPPDVPVTVTLKVPTAAALEAEMMRVEEELPPAGGVTLLGEKVAPMPFGKLPETARLTAEFRLLMLPTFTVVLAVLFWVTVTEVGEMPSVKSGGKVTAKLRVVALPIAPEVPVTFS
jgi:hypothetical protein